MAKKLRMLDVQGCRQLPLALIGTVICTALLAGTNVLAQPHGQQPHGQQPSGMAAAPVVMPQSPTPTAADAALVVRTIKLLGAAGGRERAAQAGPLAELSDVRAAKILTYVALNDRNVSAAVAAVKGLGRMGLVARIETLDLLHRIAVTPIVRGVVARTALDQIGRHRSRKAFDLLMRVVNHRELATDLRQAASTTARLYFPKRKDELPRLAGSAFVATVGGALFGGYTLGSIGRFSPTGDEAEPIGWVAGLALGGASGLLIGRELPPERQAYHFSALFWGSVVGYLGGASVLATPSEFQSTKDYDRNLRAFSVLGEGLGWLAAWSVVDRLDMSMGDVMTANLGGSVGLLLAFGALQFPSPIADNRPGSAVLTLGTLAGVGLAGWGAKSLTFSPGGVSLLALGAAEGAWYGGFFSNWANSGNSARSRRTTGGMLMGAGLGILGGGLMSQTMNLTPGDVGQMLVLSTYGKMLGAGLVMLAGRPSRIAGVSSGSDFEDRINIAHLVGGSLGMLAGASISRELSYQGGDFALVAMSTTYGIWHGAAVAFWLDKHQIFDDDQALGLTLVTPAALGVGSLLLAQELSLSTLGATMSGVGGVWGAWLVGWSAELADWHAADTLMAAAIGGDIGVAISAALISPLVNIDPRVVGGASVGGVGGAAVATMLAMMVSSDSDTWIKANLVGTTVGLLAGGLVTARVVSGRRPAARAGTQGLGLGDGWTRWIKGFAATPLMGPAGIDGAMLQLDLNVWGK
ncbi:MAG: hypothetical protein KC502_13915 [Myxococcales bacterium]|nr:hypothetical protein [Myxococcales bacterium]